jgi:Protein of unknown function (DUF3891)
MLEPSLPTFGSWKVIGSPGVTLSAAIRSALAPSFEVAAGAAASGRTSGEGAWPMMFRESPDATIAIAQPAHAWISGQIMRAWGNAAFGLVTPYEDVCLGAEQHDIGWLVWEQAPTFNSATGRPHSFRALTVAAHTAIWRQGTDMALVLGCYPALLASLHGTGLYAAFDARTAKPQDARIVHDFLMDQMAIQRRLIAGLSAVPVMAPFATPEVIERNRGLVRAADRLSIAICTALRDPAVRTDDPQMAVIRDVPTEQEPVAMRLSIVDGDPARIAVDPWPFRANNLRVACDGIALPPRPFPDEAAMRRFLTDAPRMIIAAELLPG